MRSAESKIILKQDKLNVTKKQRANLFAWRGQFTPQFIDYILDSFSRKGFTVMDPFSGSGTVLQACAYKGLSGYGYEINRLCDVEIFHLVKSMCERSRSDSQ